MPLRVINRVRVATTATAAAIIACLSMAFAGQAPSGLLAVTHVSVIDTETGSIQRDVTLLIAGDRIAGIGSSTSASGARVVFDARGAYAIPGLWDMHVHLSWAGVNALPLFIANGVTGVRDLGSDLGELDSWRARMDMNDLVGPRIVRAGPILNGASGNKWQIATGGPEQARGIVRALKQAGVDLIKVHRRVPRDDYFAIVQETKAQNIPLVGHIPVGVTPEEASDAGQQIEHVMTLFEGTFASALGSAPEPMLMPGLPDAIRAFRERGAAALIARFVRNQTAVTPTLRIVRSLIDPDALKDPRQRYVLQSVRKEAGDEPLLPPAERAVLARVQAELREMVRMMNRGGVTLLAGTDTSTLPAVPGFYLQDELVDLVEAGLSPLEAIRSATLNPVRVMKRDTDFGRVVQGKVADIVLVEGNPTEDIHNIQRITGVIARGRLFRRNDLDALLKSAEATASQR